MNMFDEEARDIIRLDLEEGLEHFSTGNESDIQVH